MQSDRIPRVGLLGLSAYGGHTQTPPDAKHTPRLALEIERRFPLPRRAGAGAAWQLLALDPTGRHLAIAPRTGPTLLLDTSNGALVDRIALPRWTTTAAMRSGSRMWPWLGRAAQLLGPEPWVGRVGRFDEERNAAISERGDQVLLVDTRSSAGNSAEPENTGASKRCSSTPTGLRSAGTTLRPASASCCAPWALGRDIKAALSHCPRRKPTKPWPACGIPPTGKTLGSSR